MAITSTTTRKGKLVDTISFADVTVFDATKIYEKKYNAFRREWVYEIFEKIVHTSVTPLDNPKPKDYDYEAEIAKAVTGGTVEEKRGRGRPRKDGTPAQPRQHPTYVAPNPNLSAQILEQARNAAESAATRTMVDIFTSGISAKIDAHLGQIDRKFDERFNERVLAVENWMNTVVDNVKKYKNLTITSERGSHVVPGKQHKKFELLVKAMTTTFPVMMVGPAGSGKTFATERIADAFGLPYYAISVGIQTSQSALLGFISADGRYLRTQFREAYENGGVFLMDEIDAGNATVLVVLNSALAGSQCAFPDKMVAKHKDFVFVSTANTYGTGANRQYVGRNQLDAATLDRFITIDWPVDEDLEFSMIEHFKDGERWHKVVKALRHQSDTNGYRMVISPRATLKGAQLLALDVDFQTTLNMTILSNAPQDHATALRTLATSKWNMIQSL